MSKKKSAMPRQIDLQQVPQGLAAMVCGVPLHKLKDHPELRGRNVDGTWNLPELVQGLATDYKAAKFNDDETEVVIRAVEEMAAEIPANLVDKVSRVVSRHGAAGFAAFGELVLAEMKLSQSSGYSHRSEAEILAEADRQIAEAKRRQSVAEGRSISRCVHCRKYRWGTTWRRTPQRRGLVEIDTICPDCWS